MNSKFSRHFRLAPRLIKSNVTPASAPKKVLPRPQELSAARPIWKVPAMKRTNVTAADSAARRGDSSDYAFEPFLQQPNGRMSGMIAPLLPSGVTKNPMLLETEVAPGMHLMIGATGKLSSDRPGNGGFRIWKYDSKHDAAAEAVALAQGMEVKHMVYNTGCAGAKVVCNIGDRSIQDLDKKQLLDHLNKVLVSLDGAMYTGCDLNSTLDDMAYLADKSPYILAAIGNDKVDPNHATAHGVVGAIIAVLRTDLVAGCDGASVVFDGAEACEISSRRISTLLAGKKLLVHGCGAVGSVVARELAAMGAEVQTIDADATRANVAGCTNISQTEAGKAWWTLDVDAIVPCSASGLITSEMIAQMKTKNIVGASNLPFNSAATQKVAEQQASIRFVPEGVTSAGAVIVDSVEQHDNEAFTQALPDELYAFCRQHVFQKTGAVLAMAKKEPSAVVSEQLPRMLELQRKESLKGSPIGRLFSSWSKARATAPATAAAVRQALTNGLSGSSGSLLMNQKKALGMQAERGTRAMSTTAESRADVVLCGGGIMALNIAYQLKCR